MSNEIVFVGAGPIGLWTAIQIKLQRPDIHIVFKERHRVYKRLHTLHLKDSSLNGSIEDNTGVIAGLQSQLKDNPHIRTNILESDLLDLAKALNIQIDYQKIGNIEEILREYPNPAMIIGADGAKSKTRTQVFGQDNSEKRALAYAAQIKYSVQGEAIHENQLWETYPLLKHSNYVAFVNEGKKEDQTTPVTIQHIIDENTYELLKEKATFETPIKLFSDKVDEQLPSKLLHDIKTHIGFRIANKENIIVDSAVLTVTELPQLRNKKTTLLKNGVYYGLIGDAALNLSFFAGMNTGLPLGTIFSKYIVANWDKIIAADPEVFLDYETFYQYYAETALHKGEDTGKSIKVLHSAINTSTYLPFQILYYENNQIADFHRHFNILHRASQFFLEANLGIEKDKPPTRSAQTIHTWLEEQIPQGLVLLKKNLTQVASQQRDLQLKKALLRLANINPEKLNLYQKAYLGLAMSKTCDLILAPTEEKHRLYCKFAEEIKNVRSGLSLMLSSILQMIAGMIAVALSIAATVVTGGAATILTSSGVGIGSALAAHGIYRICSNIKGQNATFQATNAILEYTRPIMDLEDSQLQAATSPCKSRGLG